MPRRGSRGGGGGAGKGGRGKRGLPWWRWCRGRKRRVGRGTGAAVAVLSRATGCLCARADGCRTPRSGGFPAALASRSRVPLVPVRPRLPPVHRPLRSPGARRSPAPLPSLPPSLPLALSLSLSRLPPRLGFARAPYLVDPASSICLSQRLSHACLSTHGRYSETANGSLNQLWFLWSLAPLLLG